MSIENIRLEKSCWRNKGMVIKSAWHVLYICLEHVYRVLCNCATSVTGENSDMCYVFGGACIHVFSYLRQIAGIVFSHECTGSSVEGLSSSVTYPGWSLSTISANQCWHSATSDAYVIFNHIASSEFCTRPVICWLRFGVCQACFPSENLVVYPLVLCLPSHCFLGFSSCFSLVLVAIRSWLAR